MRYERPPAMRPTLREPNETPRAMWAIPIVIGIAAAALGVYRAAGGHGEPDDPEPSATASADAPRPPPDPRCVEISTAPFMVGEPSRPRAPADPSPAPSAAREGDDLEDSIAPYAVEVGHGAVFDGGFAAGMRREGEGGAVAMVATIGADGAGGKLVRLGRSRGDLDPPVVAGAGDAVLAVMVEPNAGGHALKVARVKGGEVTWGPELSEGRDASLAVDVAASGARAVLVWDDLRGGTEETRRSSVMLASFDVATMTGVTPARPISPAGVDATTPHLVARPGGYWLGYLARGDEAPAEKKKKPRTGKDDIDESDDQGEAILASWIEMMPLDEAGTPAGAARAITPRTGHVLTFDLTLGENGSALAAWRDDDTPTGSSGGRLSSVLVRLGGVGEARVLLEEAGGAGAPDLLPGWLSLASVNGPTRIAAMTPAGELLDDFGPEPSLGTGVPIAATRDAILWARPMGRAMRLSVMRCRQRAAGSSVDAGAGDGGG
jgi:hypothetical protein